MRRLRAIVGRLLCAMCLHRCVWTKRGMWTEERCVRCGEVWLWS